MSTIKVTNLRHESATSSNITLDSSNNAVVAGTLGCTGDLTVTSGNVVLSSGNGIDFSAAGSAGGMTSELLDDYEEGTFTPTWEATVNSGTWAATGRYTKIGRLVTIEVKQTSGQVSASASNHIISGVPFEPNLGTTGSAGSLTDGSPLLTGQVLIWSSTRIYSSVAISNNSAVRITATYMTDD